MKSVLKDKTKVKRIAAVIIAAALLLGGYLLHVSSMNKLKEQLNVENQAKLTAIENYNKAQAKYENTQSELTSEQKKGKELSEEMLEAESKIASLEEEKVSLSNKIAAMIATDEYVFQTDTVLEEIREIGELATAEYRYTDCAGLKASKKWTFIDKNIPLTEKTAICSMDGVLKVGIDVNKVKITCNEKNKTITVTIPQAKLLSNELDENSTKVYSEKDGLFNAVTIDDSTELRKNIKAQSEAKAKTNGIYEQARENAKRTIQLIIESVPSVKENYTIIYK